LLLTKIDETSNYKEGATNLLSWKISTSQKVKIFLKSKRCTIK